MRQRQSVGILCDARQQLARARRLDHCDGAVAHGLCQHRIERHQEVQALAGVGVDDGEQRGIGDVEIGLIERDLRGVDLVKPGQSVAFDGAPALGLQGLVFPDRRIDQVGQLRSSDQDAVRVAAE